MNSIETKTVLQTFFKLVLLYTSRALTIVVRKVSTVNFRVLDQHRFLVYTLKLVRLLTLTHCGWLVVLLDTLDYDYF